MNDKLELNNITKLYKNVGVKALNNVSATFKMGEITSIAGENGAGKSTLVKIIFGIVSPDSGFIKLNGKEAHIHSSQDAIKHKIGMVFQHFKLIEEFTIAQNIALGRAKKKHLLFTDLEAINNEVQALIDKYEFKLKATTLV
ncbi:MAG: ATP-binding cassette domain-containing protein, partial [Sphaerochaetaceae bacterium]|nr:ATP-binding cassette domain-containing protein [Sphaerochaetaceae bacterium]